MQRNAPVGHHEVSAETPSTKRSVCIITQNQSFGGMEVHTLGLMQALIDRGHSIELVANRYCQYDEIVRSKGWQQNVTIIRTDLGGILYGDRSDGRLWRRVLGRTRSRILIFPKGNNNDGTIGFLRACRGTFEKVVFIEHSASHPRSTKGSRRWLGLIPGFGLWWHKRRFLSRRGSRYADGIIAVCGAVRNHLVQDYGYASSKVVVIPNGIPWREFVRSEERGRAFRARHGLAADTFVFGMLTRISVEKRIDVAIRAFSLLRRTSPERPCCLVIAGEGIERDGLVELARDLDVKDRVRFIGFIPDPKEVLSGFDAIVFSSAYEGLPLGLLEGMAAGCVPIVTRVGGMPEAVDAAEAGWVVAAGNPQELSDAMRSAVSLDLPALARMRQRALQCIRHHYDVSDCHRKILAVCGL
jgi:glycosyltransferase involved in cell wall biosynthesis